MTNVWLNLIIVLLLCSSISEARRRSSRKRSECKEVEECIKGENDIECVKRVKRHCPESTASTCNECDCGYCSDNDCSSTCESCCSYGSSSIQPCSTSYCCYKTCNVQCSHTRSHTCRSRCRNSCDKAITDEQSGNGQLTGTVQMAEAVNVTTVINLHNKINNTNLIDVPVNVNTSNFNNLTLDSIFEGQGVDVASPQYDLNYSSPQTPQSPPINQHPPQIYPPGHPPQGPTQPGSPPQFLPQHPPQFLPHHLPQFLPQHPPPFHPQQHPSCCQVISPRQCVPQQQFPFTKCFHYRRKHCGPTCTSHIMHAQQHQVCDQDKSGSPQCHSQLIYIPQPPHQRCVYQPTWPYVNCGGPPPNCEGCYDPEEGEEAKQQCSPNCFDGAFGGPPQGPPPFVPPWGGYPGPFMGGHFVPFMPYAGGMPFGYPPMFSAAPTSPNIDNSGSVVMDDKSKPPAVPGTMNAVVPSMNMGNLPYMGNLANMGNMAPAVPGVMGNMAPAVPGAMGAMVPSLNMGNMHNTGNMANNMGNMANLGNLANSMGNMGNMASLGNMPNIGNMANMGNMLNMGDGIQASKNDPKSTRKVASVTNVMENPVNPNQLQAFADNSIMDYPNEIDYSDADFPNLFGPYKRGAQYPSKGKKKTSENRRKKHHEDKKKEAMIVVEPRSSPTKIEDTKQE